MILIHYAQLRRELWIFSKSCWLSLFKFHDWIPSSNSIVFLRTSTPNKINCFGVYGLSAASTRLFNCSMASYKMTSGSCIFRKCILLSSPMWLIFWSQSLQLFLKRYWKLSDTALVIELVVELRSDFKHFGSIVLKIVLISAFLMPKCSRHFLLPSAYSEQIIDAACFAVTCRKFSWVGCWRRK